MKPSIKFKELKFGWSILFFWGSQAIIVKLHCISAFWEKKKQHTLIKTNLQFFPTGFNLGYTCSVVVVVVVVFVALRPMSTDMVIVGRSVHLTTLFPGQA